MIYENEYFKRNLYTLELQHKICKEHIEDGAKLGKNILERLTRTNASLRQVQISTPATCERINEIIGRVSICFRYIFRHPRRGKPSHHRYS